MMWTFQQFLVSNFQDDWQTMFVSEFHYRVIAKIENNDFVITNLHVGHRYSIYRRI